MAHSNNWLPKLVRLVERLDGRERPAIKPIHHKKLLEENMKTINFKFDLNQKIITPLGNLGIVTMCAFDSGGNEYYVITSKTQTWYLESLLTAHDETVKQL